MHRVFTFIIVLLLSGCQTAPKSIPDSDNAIKEVFDVETGRDIQQISTTRLAKGWMYELTNDGLPTNDPNMTERMLVVELEGKSSPVRLKTIFLSNCHELHYEEKMENGYFTWLDILSCPEYKTAGNGILIINKSIQGTNKFFGATLYKVIPWSGYTIPYLDDELNYSPI